MKNQLINKAIGVSAGIIYTYLFVLTPLAVAMELYISANNIAIETYPDLIKAMGIYFREVLKEAPFFDIYNDVFIEGNRLSTLSFRYFLNNFFMSVIQFGFFDLLTFSISKHIHSLSFSVNPGKKILRYIRLGSAYTTWLPLIVYISALLIFKVSEINLPYLDFIVSICFLIIAVARFSYTSKTPLVFSFFWVIFKIIIFGSASCFILFFGGNLIQNCYETSRFYNLFRFVLLAAVSVAVFETLEFYGLKLLVSLRARLKK